MNYIFFRTQDLNVNFIIQHNSVNIWMNVYGTWFTLAKKFIMQEKQMRRIIVDTDVGTDDYLALMILLYAEKKGKLKIEAIICSNGNTTTSHVTRNVIRLLEIVGRTDIAVYKGAEEPLILPRELVKKFHGTDGFGDLQYDKEPNVGIIKDTPGSIILHDIVLKSPNEISVICLGPLTTLALAIKLYSDLASKIKDVWIMGGNCRAVGNITSTAEFNFFIDSEAAHIVLECLKCKIFILPWEPCLLPNISMEWRHNVLGDNTAVLGLLTKAEKKLYQGYNKWIPCDGFLAYCFLDPKLYIIRQSLHHATIELYTSHTRGQMVLDHMKNKTPNVTVIEEFNKNLFMELLLEVKNALC